MKKGQMILGAVALVVTAGSTLAFKVANKFGSHHKLYVKISSTSCKSCTTIWTKASGVAQRTSCKTVSGGKHVGSGTGNHIFYTQSGCTGAFSLITTVQ